jgi:hypothetical protein
MASQSPEAFYAAVKAQPDRPIKFGKAQAVVQTPVGQPDQKLQLPTDEEAAKLLKVADDGAPYPAPAATRPNAGVVYSAAAEVLTYEDRFLDGKAPVVTYKPELKHTKWEFPSNAKGAKAAAKPTVSSPLSDTEWGDSIKADLQRHADSGVPRLLVFVHGYNTLPAEANDTAHRLLQPVGPDGGLGVQAVVSFTWDSAGRTLSYPHEEFMAECETLSDHLANLIRRLLHIKLDNGKHWQLVILAHSMGNRPTTMALGKVYSDEKAALQLNTADLPMLVINAAADIDASTYSQKMQPVMSLLGDAARAIVLVSSHDMPLIMSYIVHDRPAQANGKEQRVGLLFQGLSGGWQGLLKFPVIQLGRLRNTIGGLFGHGGPVIKVPHLDVIDCSIPSEAEIAMNGNGHGYYVHIESVRAEIVAAMAVPDTASRLQQYSQSDTNSNASVNRRLEVAPPGNPRPFVLFDGPLYKIQ